MGSTDFPSYDGGSSISATTNSNFSKRAPSSNSRFSQYRSGTNAPATHMAVSVPRDTSKKDKENDYDDNDLLYDAPVTFGNEPSVDLTMTDGQISRAFYSEQDDGLIGVQVWWKEGDKWRPDFSTGGTVDELKDKFGGCEVMDRFVEYATTALKAEESKDGKRRTQEIAAEDLARSSANSSMLTGGSVPTVSSIAPTGASTMVSSAA